MRAFAVAAALALAGSQAVAQTATSAETELAAFGDTFDQAQLRKDGAALEKLVADDLVFITSSGKRQGKKEFIAGWTDADTSYNPITLIDRRVVPLGADAGLISAETVLSGKSGGKEFASRIRFTDTFRRGKDGQFQAIHIQVTRIPD